jgi:hypothetical protein
MSHGMSILQNLSKNIYSYIQNEFREYLSKQMSKHHHHKFSSSIYDRLALYVFPDDKHVWTLAHNFMSLNETCKKSHLQYMCKYTFDLLNKLLLEKSIALELKTADLSWQILTNYIHKTVNQNNVNLEDIIRCTYKAINQLSVNDSQLVQKVVLASTIQHYGFVLGCNSTNSVTGSVTPLHRAANPSGRTFHNNTMDINIQRDNWCIPPSAYVTDTTNTINTSNRSNRQQLGGAVGRAFGSEAFSEQSDQRHGETSASRTIYDPRKIITSHTTIFDLLRNN